jgi:acetyl-CoA carboxylase biotin carboxyl carrier protein
VELKEIKAVIDLMTKNGLSEFELERQNFKLRLKRGLDGEIHPSIAPVAPVMALPHQVAHAAPAAHHATPAPEPTESGPTINSPMVGTFYMAPAPDAPAYVAVGKEVHEDTVVCIIEAMKVMNEIKAEVRGIITHVMAENGKPVEFGTPLFRIKPL